MESSSGELHDETPIRVELARGVQALHEGAVPRHALESREAHARHQFHVEHHVGAVGNFDAATGEGRVDGAHAVGHHVHGATFHAAVEQGVHFGVGCLRGHPIIVRAGVFLVLRADEGEMFDARDVGGIGAGQVTAGEATLIQGQGVLFGLPARARAFEIRSRCRHTIDVIRLGEAGDFVDPLRYIAIQRG